MTLVKTIAFVNDRKINVHLLMRYVDLLLKNDLL